MRCVCKGVIVGAFVSSAYRLHNPPTFMTQGGVNIWHRILDAEKSSKVIKIGKDNIFEDPVCVKERTRKAELRWKIKPITRPFERAYDEPDRATP